MRDADGIDLGIQVTFFRSRPGVAEASASRFAPVQLLFAHAAIADPRFGRLRHDQRAARAGFGLAEASEATTDVQIDDWSLRLAGELTPRKSPRASSPSTLTFVARQPVLLQGVEGVSRKGPRDAQASFYYSRPQLAVDGVVTVADRTQTVRGTAWLDHEWSSEYLAAEARGWDWIGINFDDGSALMAFRIRHADGSAYWAGGAIRDASGTSRSLDPASRTLHAAEALAFPRTAIEYPVAFRVEAGPLDITLAPLLDDQELDSRATVGTVYWEGAVRALAGGREVGRGYLELTGYGGALKI